ncbi:hypothetical protein CCM_09272 [Cordyceps militaris CM01]|uniref:Uncharacterized protein n=1 Tax=Cordyceps militaris (strain CM01) TaxID=983644 RepID=G3JTY2_CORMM|nr:uncharacterized protein CCM_09272 [Cordyceps militaris CM01]EGX88136.1 hypothetical protein CCM_09272 [Cordyceps militaris CM01]
MSHLVNFSIPDLTRHRTAVALLPVVLPAAYVAYLHWAVWRSTTRTTGQLSPSSAHAPAAPKGLPADVAAHPDDWVVCYERVVSGPVSAATLVHKLRGGSGNTPGPLLTAYLRTTFKAFSWTPQALLIRAMVAEPVRKASFAAAHVDGLAFAGGDVVDGVYRVTSYECKESGGGGEAVELSIDTPSSYAGPPVRGLIRSAVEEGKGGGDEVRFVNETWLWRGRREKPTMLENALGRWLHGLLAGWLVMKGVGGVTRR